MEKTKKEGNIKKKERKEGNMCKKEKKNKKTEIKKNEKKKQQQQRNMEVIRVIFHLKMSNSGYFPLECLISCFPCSCISLKSSVSRAGTDETDPKRCLIRVYTTTYLVGAMLKK